MTLDHPRILLVNANSTSSFTDGMLKSLACLAKTVEITGVTIRDAPAAINSVQTSIASTSAAYAQLVKDYERKTFDGASLSIDQISPA